MSKNMQEDDRQLTEIRVKIDEIDAQIIQLLGLRSDSIEQIAEIKCRQSLPIYDASRENSILEKATRTNPTKYQAVDMSSIFHAILRAGLNQQLLYRAEYKE